MAKLRLTVGSLRRMVDGISRLLEAEDDDDEGMSKNDQEWYAGIQAGQTMDQLKAQGLTMPKIQRAAPQAGTKNISDPTSGTGRVRSSAVKGKPGYDPLLPKEGGKSPGWLAVYDPTAFNALKKMGSPAGKIFTDGPYIRFMPADPSQKTMFWAGVPEKKTPTGAKRQGGEAKPHGWRTYEELALDQKRSLGWVSPRDRGDVEVPDEPEERGLDVRVRGGGFRAEPEVMGHVPGAEPIMPGRGGSTPSPEASLAAQRAFSAKGPPDWKKQSVQDLNSWREEATRRFKSSRDPIHAKIVRDIDQELERRAEEPEQARSPGEAVQASAPERTRGPRHTQSVEDRFGKRKRWGQTSKGAEVTKIERPKK